MACLDKSELWKEGTKAQDMWLKSKSIKQAGLIDDSSAFSKTFEVATGKEFIQGSDITAKDMRLFQQEIISLEKSLKSVGSYGNKFLRHFMPGWAKMRSHPVTREFYWDIVKGNERRANATSDMIGSYKEMVKNLKSAMVGLDKNLVDRLGQMEKDYVRSVKNKDETGTTRDMMHLMNFLQNEGAIFDDFIRRVELGPKNGDAYLRNKYKNKGKQSYINDLNNAASEWRKVQDVSKGHLIDGVRHLSDTIELKYGGGSRTAKRLTEEYKKLINHLENKEEGGYIPHYVLDVFGQAVELPSMVSAAESPKQLDEVLSQYVSRVEDINSNLIQRLKARSDKTVEYFSRNPMLYAHKYVEQVAGFNNNAFVSHKYTKALTKLSEVILRDPESEVGQASQVYLDMINSLHDQATHRNLSQKEGDRRNLVRMLTSMQFISKLGFSLRGGLRNGTQRLLNFAYFDKKTRNESGRRYKEDPTYAAGLDDQLKAKGLTFKDITAATEGAISSKDLVAAGIDIENGIVTHKDRNRILSILAQKTSKVAEYSALATQYFENVNRTSTFKMAYHQRLNQLERSTKYSNREGDPSLQKSMEEIAGNYASKVTNLLHFDYSKVGKADILTSDAGAVLGQFQHYAISFADLQYQMLKDFNRARKAEGIKSITGEEAHRLVRMAAVYSLSELASGLTNVDFTSYVNNDTLSRIAELGRFLFGDDEQQQDAFYGKGLVGAVGLVPISDAIEIHNLGAAAGYWNLLADPNSTAGWLAGIREYKKIDDSEFMKEAAGMFSIEAERIIRRSLVPTLTGQISFGAGIQAELGLYGGTTSQLGLKTRKTQEKYKQMIGTSKKKTGKMSKQEKNQALLESLSKLY